MSFDPDYFTQIESSADAYREKAEFDYDLDAAYEALEEQVQEAIEGRSLDAARDYLGTYGDAVTERLRSVIAEAETLLAEGHPGPAIALAATAVEVTVRDLVIRPIVQGAFLSDQWAAILTDQIIRGAPGEGRRLLPVIAKAWDLDLDEVRLADRASAWGVFTGQVSQARNAFVHRADPVPLKVARRGIECATAVLDGLGGALAKGLGMDWPAHPWQEAYRVGGWALRDYEPKSPYES